MCNWLPAHEANNIGRTAARKRQHRFMIEVQAIEALPLQGHVLAEDSGDGAG
jgi:hypothetical protein